MIAVQPLAPVPLRGLPAPIRRPQAMERARGDARLVVRSDGGQTRLAENYQSGSAKIRFPNVLPGEPLAAVLLNTAGGVHRRRFISSFSVVVGANAAATIATQAAERIYRRSAGVARIDTTLSAAAGGLLEWLPQETILFDGSALARTLTIEVAPDARLLAVESILLGRAAMGETAKSVALADSWRIRRGGRLVFADGLRLDGDTTAILSGGATGKGAAALATLVLVAPDAEARIDTARAALGGPAGEGGVSAWNGMLVARLIATGGQSLRTDLMRLIEALRGKPMPRVWHC